MANDVLRYLGLAIETGGYGVEESDADLHIDIASSSLDSPSEPFITYEGGIGRMTVRTIPGVYAPSGGAEFPVGISWFAYILHLLLGDSSIDIANVTPVTGEDLATGVGETEKTYSLVEKPVIQGTFIFEDSVSTQVAHDNGWGKIVEDAASGITGWIDYSTGTVYMAGLDAEEAYTGDYDWGWMEHTIVPVDGNVMPSFTAFLGKDLFEHKFLGCILSQMDFSVEQELANLTLDIMCQKDKKVTIVNLEDLFLTSGCHGERQKSFADIQLKVGDFGEALGDISAKVRTLAWTVNNNGTTEENVGLNSRFPQDGTAGALDITGTMTLQFEDTSYKEDFWGDSGGAVDGDPQLKDIEITISGGGAVDGGWGEAIVSLPRVLLQSVNIQPSGREKSMQEITFQAKYDCDSGEIISCLVKNYNRLHNPA